MIVVESVLSKQIRGRALGFGQACFGLYLGVVRVWQARATDTP